MKYHHTGIPTTIPQPGEIHMKEYKVFCTDHESNPFGIQWMRYEADCPLPDLVKTVPHVAFSVEDLATALKGHEILIQPNSPSEGVTVAFVICQGAPVEFLEYSQKVTDCHRSRITRKPAFPALQGCYSQGATYEEAMKNIQDAIRLHIEDRIADGEEFPQHVSVALSTVEVAV